MRPLRQFLTSLKTTIGLFIILGGLLLFSVALPTEKYLGPGAEGFTGSVLGRFLLGRLGLGEISTSPVFLVCIALFFLNLRENRHY